VHGGCWQTGIADRTIMNWAAADLRRRHIAVWNIEYRGVDRGGGYPSTFQDVAAAADAIRQHASRLRLDISQLAAIGHSAGGHLALWLAARSRLSSTSPLFTADPVRIAKVVSLGGLPDLEQAQSSENGCGNEVIAQLTAGHFEDTSLPRLAPIGVCQILVNGACDLIVPLAYGHDYAHKMRAAGDEVTLRIVGETGHVELVTPGTGAWTAVTAELAGTFPQAERSEART
jgi:acetyl esterase/lipase